MATGRPRGHTTSGIHRPSSFSSVSASTSSVLGGASSPNSPRLERVEESKEHVYDGTLRSSFRLRSRSHSCSPATRFIGQPVKEEDETKAEDSDDSKDGFNADPFQDTCSTPWGDQKDVDEFLMEPWTAPPGKDMIPEDLQEDWEDTRDRVSKASIAIMGVTTALVRRALVITIGASEYVPIPGLVGVAKILLTIWDAVQIVDMNRLACMRLARRCADIVLCVRQEVKEGGDVIRNELYLPLSRLVCSFKSVQNFLQKQLHCPFLKRFLKRDEILGRIKDCNGALDESIGMFNLSIQVRILRQVQESESKRAQDAESMMNTLLDVLGAKKDSIHGLPASSSHRSLTTHEASDSETESTTMQGHQPPPYEDGRTALPSSVALESTEVLPVLRNIQSTQNTLDTQRDTADLRTLMRHALETKSDVEMMKVLQIGREEMPDAIGTLERALERFRLQEPPSESPSEPGESTSKEESRLGDNSLDREFVESGIDALRRMSMGVVPQLPSWTITRYELDQDEKIGVGFFSDVFKGTWRGRSVAIKVLADVTPRKLFVREVEIWKDLKHENVLALYGASSAQGDPPWFFVSPYASNGSLVEYLKKSAKEKEVGVGLGLTNGGHGVAVGGGDGGEMNKSKPNLQTPNVEDCLFQFMWEIAKGMAYLHDNGVLHGDLKAANILVDGDRRCIITDFGQSEMRSEAYRISGTPPPRGTLRWQAPELLSGLTQLSLTPQMDIYAYAICCVEILSMGKMPYPLMDDENVRYLVLTKDARPCVPPSSYKSAVLDEFLRVCWHRDPAIRPPFRQIVQDTEFMHQQFTNGQIKLPGTSLQRELSHSSIYAAMWDWEAHSGLRMGPSQHGSPLTRFSESMDNTSITTARGGPSLMSRSASSASRCSHRRSYSSSSGMTLRMPEPSFYTPQASFHPTFVQSPYPSAYSHGHQTDYLIEAGVIVDGTLPPTSLPCEAKHRRTSSYSLTFPRGDTSPINMGAIGYMSKDNETFVTLFNAFFPENSVNVTVKSWPSLFHYIANAQREKKKSTHAVWDAFVGMLSPSGGKHDGQSNGCRRPSISMRGSPKSPAVKKYTYVESFEASQKWFKAHIDAIFQVYGPSHPIGREELVMVTGSLEKPDEPLFINIPAGELNVHVSFSPDVVKWVRAASTPTPAAMPNVVHDSQAPLSPATATSEFAPDVRCYAEPRATLR